MADEKGGSTITDMLQSRAGLAAIFMALASLLIHGSSELNSSRPSVESGASRNYGAAQDVDARLWQDPFQAVNNTPKDKPAESFTIKAHDSGKFTLELLRSEGQDSHSSDRIYANLPKKTGGSKITLIDGAEIALMAVMISAAPTPEQHEARLRRRYALVSALASMEYAPVDAEHIGYFRIEDPEKHGLPEIVPFEWFENPRKTKKDDTDPPEKVLVLWVDDAQFIHSPVKKILEVFKQTIDKSAVKKANLTRVVLGPNSSNHLRAMALEASETNFPEAENIWFYSALATASDNDILNSIAYHGGQNLAEFLNSSHIHLARTIADDKAVIDSLVNELEKRHIKYNGEGHDNDQDNQSTESAHVVLLSDWDTFYGRSLPIAFERAYEHYKNNDEGECNSIDKTSEHVHCFKYIRGIDGILPGTATKNEAKPPAQGKPEAGSASKPLDRPEGMSQKDYLRRIVDRIRWLDESLRQEKPCFNAAHRCGVAAIGVLGYDVYDKLMILQALRPYFPNKVFFTTDLSASYWSPAELPYTHNLLAASSFGLSLGSEWQKDIPPFRDSYQTAFFLSALMALAEAKPENTNWLKPPRIFEIGRNGPIDLTEPDTSNLPSEMKKEYLENPSSWAMFHPPSIFEHTHVNCETRLKIMLGIFGIALLYWTSWKAAKWIDGIFLKSTPGNTQEASASSVAKPHWKGIGLFLLFLLPILAIVLIDIFTTLNEEPWLWFEGISIWPSELLRYLALITCLALIYKGLKISDSDEQMTMAFGLDKAEDKEPAPKRKIYLNILGWHSPPKNHPCNDISNGTNRETIDVRQVWKEYRQWGKRKHRLQRSLIGVLLFLPFAWLAVVLSGGLPVPARGNFAFEVDRWLVFLAGLSMLFLTMLAVDASRLCAAFVSHLSEAQSDWHINDQNKSCKMIRDADQWGVEQSHAAYWLDVQFVAQLTKRLQNFIWYPIIPIFLMAIARSPVFDDWPLPEGLIITLTILVVYLLSCAFLLQRGAARMRQKACTHLKEELRALRKNSSDNNIRIERLERMIKEIEDLKEGAFMPFFKQPWVEAILALAGGAGGLAWFGNFLGAP